MYDELVKKIRHCATDPMHCLSCGEDKDGRCFKRLMTQAADAIEALSKLALDEHNRAAVVAWEHRWIPVSERLPECDLGAEVGNIEWISCGMVRAGCFGRGGKYRDAYFRTWTDAGEGIDAKDADYWRAVTLPEPSKGEP